MEISNYLKNLQSYSLSSQEALIRLLNNEDVAKLDWNESDISVTDELHINRYVSTNLDFYEDIIKDKLNISSEILLYAGSDHAHLEVLRTFTDNTKSIMIVGPTYDNFRTTAESFGSKIYRHIYDSNNNLENDIITLKPNIVYICNPNNPYGYIHPDLDRIVNKHPNTLFLIDEAYIEFSDNNTSYYSGLPNVIYFRTFSKAFCHAGLRLGFICCNKNLKEKLQILYNPKFISKYALDFIENLPIIIPHVNIYINKIINNRTVIQSNFSEFGIDFVPSQANFIFLPFYKPEILYDKLKSQNIYTRLFKNFWNLNSGVRITIPSNNLHLEKILDFFYKMDIIN